MLDTRNFKRTRTPKKGIMISTTRKPARATKPVTAKKDNPKKVKLVADMVEAMRDLSRCADVVRAADAAVVAYDAAFDGSRRSEILEGQYDEAGEEFNAARHRLYEAVEKVAGVNRNCVFSLEDGTVFGMSHGASADYDEGPLFIFKSADIVKIGA
jgi:hypothetical protein